MALAGASIDIDERNRMIGENLRKYRLIKGMTQDELAEGLCSVSQLSKAENGKTYIKRTLLKQMADRLGVTVERIEATDALLEELKEQLQLVKDAYNAGNYERALEIVETVITRCLEFDYTVQYVDALIYKAQLTNAMRVNPEDTIQMLEAILLSGTIESCIQRVQIHLELGLAYELYGNMTAAHDNYCRADEMFTDTEGSLSDRLRILFHLNRCHTIMKNYRTALRYGERAERLAREGARHLSRLRTHYMNAYSMRMIGRYEEAEEIYHACLQEAQDNSYLLDVAILNNNIGELYQSRGDTGQARAYYNRALRIHSLLNVEIYKMETLLHFAELCVVEGFLSEAVEYLNEVLSINDRLVTKSHSDYAKAHYLLGKVKGAQGDFAGMIDDLEQVLFLYENNQMLRESYDLAVELAELLDQREDERALVYYRRAVAVNKSIQQLRR